MDCIQSVLKTIRNHDLIQPGDTVLCGFSGGADSVAMLHMLYRLSPILQCTIAAAHVNHLLRGEEAERDQAFAEEFCNKIGIPFYTCRKNVAEAASRLHISTEEAGRNIRYEYFEELCRSLPADKIATAHHADDQSETILLHLLRGCGINGLKGIPLQRGIIIRPLLNLSRKEIEEYCRANTLNYVMDSSNLAEDYTRNKIRHTLLPIIKRDFNPNISKALTQLARQAAEQDRLNAELTANLS